MVEHTCDPTSWGQPVRSEFKVSQGYRMKLFETEKQNEIYNYFVKKTKSHDFFMLAYVKE